MNTEAESMNLPATVTVANQAEADARIPGATSLDLGPIKSRLAKASAGPWRWELNRDSRRLQLCGGIPRFDLIVMDFVRWGMNGACPRFNKELRTNMNVMERAEMYGVDQPGREHHASWFQLLRHHDAQLIEHAPADIAALVSEVESLRSELASRSGRTLDRKIHEGGTD